MCAERRPVPRRAVRGFSIVEVMVGIVIALLIGLAATGSARFFASSQRQGMSVGAMSTNVNSALGAIKTDIATAGLGFFGDSLFACHKLDFAVGGTMKFDNAAFSPLLITRSGGNDQLDVISSTSIDGGANVLLAGTSDGTSATTQSRLPAVVGDAVMLVPATPGGPTPCMVRSVTAVADLPLETAKPAQTFTFANTGVYNQMAFGAAQSYVGASRDRIALLGKLFWSRYSLEGTKLVFEQPLAGKKGTLLSNVMAFRVQYGVSADATNKTLTGWQDATAAPWLNLGGATVDRVRALRIGIVTRSAQPEKKNAAGNCEASATKPTDPFDSSVPINPDVTDWGCYRYRTAVLVVPLRNLVW